MTKVRTSQLQQMGATTGQGLVWNGTAWLPANVVDGDKIPKSLVDAKGDLIVASANDVVGRLPVGTDGQVLVADTTAALGVRWSPPPQTGHTVQEEGVALPPRLNLNFVGASVTATDDAANNATKVTFVVDAGYKRFVDLGNIALAGQGSFGATMKIARALGITSAGASTASMSPKTRYALALVSAGAGALNPTIGAKRGVAVTVAGVSTASATPARKVGLSMTSAGASTAAPTMTVTNAPSGYAAAYSGTY